MLKRISLILTLLMITSAPVSATLISGGLNVDNGYVAYLSTDDLSPGVLISSGNNWMSTYTFSDVNLTAGQSYFLHIYAYDQGGIAGFLGQFDLTGAGHLFANGQSSLLTNTTDWKVSTTGWNDYQAVSFLGVNGVSPWGTRAGVSGAAEWIWSSDANNHNVNYFTTAINAVAAPTAVPEPNSLFLMSLVLLGLVVARKKMI
ncbi:PEP-CTERM sorting domain-containing protein [Arsukibacterium sp.]|uniref:PEP-CTERM sorting domain-containing protein n=1 Tax=Arsukibacterium sp. TaxID=1977258 RepID=UPI001BD30695|nr:PEP-CTERM sorting domain-containing protein [Arsukibacterium sp.]